MAEFFERAIPIAVVLASLAILVLVPFYLLTGGLRTFALKPLERCYEGIHLCPPGDPWGVHLVYHTYRGLVLWITQDEHNIVAPAADAERLLGRLLRFNLTWGMLSFGIVFVPILAIANYFAQRRSIARQVRSGPRG